MARLSSAGGSPVTRSHRQAGGSKGHTVSSWMHWYIVLRAWRPSGLSKLKAWREGPARRSPCSHAQAAVDSSTRRLRVSSPQTKRWSCQACHLPHSHQQAPASGKCCPKVSTSERAGALHGTLGQVQQLDVPTAGCYAMKAWQLGFQGCTPARGEALGLQQAQRPCQQGHLLRCHLRLSSKAAALA